jgi:alpha-tubulin suppressor-like RCC1 family protein
MCDRFLFNDKELINVQFTSNSYNIAKSFKFLYYFLEKKIMTTKRSSSFLSIIFTVMLILLLVFPTRVFAEGEDPTVVPATTEAAPAATVEPLLVTPDITPIPATAGPTPVSTEVPAESLAEATAVPVDLLAATELPIETQPAASESTEAAPVVDNSTLIADTVTALQEAGVVLVDTAGSPIPLASQAAADALVAPDPVGCPPGVTPAFMGGTGLGCTTNYLSIQQALDDPLVPINGGWTIFIEQGNYNENVLVNKSVKFTGLGAGATATSISLFKDIDNASSWFSSLLVIVNPGASISDGLNLVAPGGTVRTSVKTYQGASDINGNANIMIRDNSANASPTYEVECGEPNVFINLNTTYNMILMEPFDPTIVNYYNPNATEELEDLCVAVNVAKDQGWSTNSAADQWKQRQVYWKLLNKSDAGHPFDTAFQTLVSDIQNDLYDSVQKRMGIYFIVPTLKDNGITPSPASLQLTFIATCDDGDPTTINMLNADGICEYQTKTCNDGSVNTTDTLNANGTCSFTCVNGATNAPTCTYPSAPKTLPLTIAPLIIPVTGACVPDIITAGIGHTCAVTPKTGLRCWGLNDVGQLGDGKNSDSTVPVKVKVLDGSEVLSLVSGTKHTCALTNGGEVMCWGLNYSGQLGNGTTTDSNIPVKVTGLSGTIVAISAGENFTCAVNDANTNMCWGNNSAGQFKNGKTENSNIPVVADLGNNVSMVSGGKSELQGVLTNGAIQFWSNLATIPVTGFANDVALVSADRFTEGGCAMNTDGKVECWGAILGSEISGGQKTDPLLITKKTCYKEPLVTGEGHGCMVTDKGLVCWGKNDNGQLGDGTQSVSEKPVAVTGINSVIDLAAGFKHTCAIVGVEDIKCWGRNTYGQLGNGTTIDSLVPAAVK